MSNIDSNQAATMGSSSNENKDTNFITQQNFINNQVGDINNQRQSNFQNNQKEDKNFSSVSIKKTTIKKTTKVKKSKNPAPTKKSMKASLWNEESFETKVNDEEYINERKRNKILKMIKNAHVEKLKNYIFLKEINNAHDEIERFSQQGEMAEAKEMERELNTLHASVIQSNIDTFSKSKLARSHAMFGNTFSSFKDNKSTMNTRKNNVYQTQRDFNVNRLFNATTKTYINQNIEEKDEDNEENEEEVEEVETRIEKKKNNKNNKNRKKNQKKTQKKNNNKKQNLNGDNQIRNSYDQNINQNNQSNNPNYNINNPNGNFNQNPNQFQNQYQNQFSNQFPNQNPNQFQNQIPNQYQNQFSNQFPNQIQFSNQNNIMRNAPNMDRSESSHYQINEKINQQKYNEQIQYINDNDTTELKFQNQSRKEVQIPSNEGKPLNIKDYTRNAAFPPKEEYHEENEKENSDIIDDNKKEPQTENYIGDNTMNQQKKDILFSVATISSTVVEMQNSDNKLPIVNNKDDNKEKNPEEEKIEDKPVEERLNLAPTLSKVPEMEKEFTNSRIEEPLEDINSDLAVNLKPKPDYKQLSQSFVPEKRDELELSLRTPISFEKGPTITNMAPSPRSKYDYPTTQNYYPPKEKINPNYPPQNPYLNRDNPYPIQNQYQYPRPKERQKKRSPKKKSPIYNKPKKPYQPENYYNPPENFVLNSRPNIALKRPQSSQRPYIYPQNPYTVKYEYPRRYRDYRPRSELSRSKSKSESKEKRKSLAEILFAYPSSGKCFACDVKCSISRSGNSPNKYVPYMASYKQLRKDITYYDPDWGYYQYSSKFPENN